MMREAVDIIVPKESEKSGITHQLNFRDFLMTEQMITDLSDKDFKEVISLVTLRFKHPSDKQVAIISNKQKGLLLKILRYLSRNIMRNRINRVRILMAIARHKGGKPK